MIGRRSLTWLCRRDAQDQDDSTRVDSETHLLRTPPKREAFRHSGGERRRCTSPTVTLYLEVELSSDRRPGTEQKTSVGEAKPEMTISLLSLLRALMPGNRGRGGWDQEASGE